MTKNGKPVSRMVPYRQRPETIFGATRGAIKVVGDIVEPIDVDWEASG